MPAAAAGIEAADAAETVLLGFVPAANHRVVLTGRSSSSLHRSRREYNLPVLAVLTCVAACQITKMSN